MVNQPLIALCLTVCLLHTSLKRLSTKTWSEVVSPYVAVMRFEMSLKTVIAISKLAGAGHHSGSAVPLGSDCIWRWWRGNVTGSRHASWRSPVCWELDGANEPSR